MKTCRTCKYLKSDEEKEPCGSCKCEGEQPSGYVEVEKK